MAAGTGCPGSQGQAEARSGLEQALAEEALVKQILWQLSGHWGWEGVAGSWDSRAS